MPKGRTIGSRLTLCDVCSIELGSDAVRTVMNAYCPRHAKDKHKNFIAKKVGQGYENTGASFVSVHSNHIPEEPNHCGRG